MRKLLDHASARKGISNFIISSPAYEINIYVPLCVPVLSGHTQKLLKGVVLDAEKNIAVPSASVFFNNTSIGTTATAEGHFQLLFLTAGKYDLIVSSIGYKPISQTIVAGELPADFLNQPEVKSPGLETIVIAPFEKNGWEKWGQVFYGTTL